MRSVWALVVAGMLVGAGTAAALAQPGIGKRTGTAQPPDQTTAAQPPHDAHDSPAPNAAAATIGASTLNIGRVPVLERVLREWPEGKVDTVKNPGEWSYEEGVLLDGITAEWRQTGDSRLFGYLRAAVDRSVDSNGNIHMADGKPFPIDAHSLDNIEMGRSVVTLYRVTQDPRYYKAAYFLHDMVQHQPKNASGGYWHKQIYPDQMWLDGAYMAEPFMASYARTFQQNDDLAEVANQLLLMDAKMRDRRTGLLRHGWDESMKMDWADKQHGLSPEVWARAMGWYVMALVDVLERMPDTDPQRAAVEDLARRTLAAIIRFQDRDTGLWWQVMDKGARGQEPAAKGNFLEASASCMFVYAIAKGVRLGLLPMSEGDAAVRGWGGIQSHFVKPDGTLTGTVKVAGLGGNPYRSGTYDYYIGEATGDNDAKGVGAYLLAESEMLQRERSAGLMTRGMGKTVMVDAWFNSQKRKTADGHEELFHYKFSDDANSGYSAWGRMFQQYGMRLDTGLLPPRADELKGVAILILASPDVPSLNPNPHYMDKASADAIENWVKGGGVLVIMQNDKEHAEFEHFNTLTERFGVHLNATLRNQELNGSYEDTVVNIPAGTGGIFHAPHKALMKEICTMTLSGPTKAVLTDKGDVLMAVAHAGKGWVYVNCDPWLYNEYTDGRALPLGEDNFAAGQELTRWLVGRLPSR